jgi:gliding motility-associated-like protein
MILFKNYPNYHTAMPTTLRFLVSAALVLLAIFLPQKAHATHNRAGEIHIEQIGPLTVRATIVTWTKSSSPIDRDTLLICWGDGSCESVARNNNNGQGQIQANDIRYNTYVAIHTFAGAATYTISLTDQNRNAGIINVNPPTSENIPFHVETVYSFQNPQFGGVNTTPYLLQPPIDNACVGKPFKHNPNAFDPDGDSLSYHLIVPFQGTNSLAPNYSFPYQIGPGPNNILQLDPITGDLTWASPQITGEYNIAMIIVSWRNGIPIDTTVRDMQIEVFNCQNNPPVVTAIDQICVVAGQTVAFDVVATDPDSANLVRLSALGGPFSTPYSPATFTVVPGWQLPPLTGRFEWVTDCEHISDQAYSVVFKAVDTINKNTPPLVDLKAVSIKVVGPAPEDVQADAGQGRVELSWLRPYACEVTDNNYFYGFSVWRREGSNPFPLDTCDPGLAGKGYTELIFVTRDTQNGRYVFVDNNVQRGRTYCYRVLAKFARTSAGGFPYNLVESLPSAEVCVQLPRDLPLITNASVEATSTAAGQVQVCWSKPVAADLDTLQNAGPYRYQVLRAEGLSGGPLLEIPGASLVAVQFWQANDTCFLDQNLNTASGPFHYQVDFYVEGNAVPLGSTNAASTVFLDVASSDQTNTLTWQEVVPWGNYKYDVYRFDDATSLFEKIGTTFAKSFKDNGLENGKSYCYRVQSIGTYGVGGVVDPILNWSQEDCGTPLDTMPPCPPVLTIANRCTTGEAVIEPDPAYENLLSWTNPEQACPPTDDVLRYLVWYAPSTDEPLALLTTLDGATNTQFLHALPDGLVGCYAVSAVDSVGNESLRSNQICTDNCPEYLLPNAFTPNGDGANDVFEPFPGWRFVERVDLQIFNRWGNLVFETTDPAIGWTGTNADGSALADGTYFFVCKVYEQRVGGVVQRSEVLSGWIELLRM